MSANQSASAADLDRLRQFDSCTLSNAIERFDVRLRNEGFMSSVVRCRFPRLAPMIGHAVTGCIRTSSPPMTGGWYHENMDFWRYVATIPPPRVLVMRDADPRAGVGAFVGALHAHIGGALDCAGYVTNGAVRDLPAVEATGFQLFAGSVAVSHAYAHVVALGEPVEVGGLTVRPGDLLFGDRHGVLAIPPDLAAVLPDAARRLLAEERDLIELCGSPRFSLDALGANLAKLANPAHPSHTGGAPARPRGEDLS
jgi:4-hydroxy-4-methyl-2-oxoglutarate aldolase